MALMRLPRPCWSNDRRVAIKALYADPCSKTACCDGLRNLADERSTLKMMCDQRVVFATSMYHGPNDDVESRCHISMLLKENRCERVVRYTAIV